MEWTTACPGWEKRIIAGESLIPCPPLFPDRAEYALSVFKQLRVFDVPGQPTMGEVCRPWVFDFVGAIFGAYDSNSGQQLIREFLLHISKKNTKSTIASGAMLTAAIVNWRFGAEFLIVAPTKEIAENSYMPARWMIKLDPELDDLFDVHDHTKTINHRTMGTVLKVVAADKDTVSGKKATAVLVDELWLFGERSNAGNMFAEATGGLASRPEGFIVYLTTQADKAPTGVFKEKLDYGRGVRDGRIVDPAFMPVLYEFPERYVKDKLYLNPKNFYMTNPNLGSSVGVSFLEREFKKAEESGEESMCGFLAKHLNVEIGMALKSSRWAGADFWEQADTGLTLEKILEKSDVITIGGDGGGLDDLLGLCVLGRDATDSRRWMAWIRAWAHPIALERRKSEKSRYMDFKKDGDLVIVEDIGQDIEQFCQIVKQCEDSGLLDRIGVDPAGIGDIVDAIVGIGIDHDRVVGVPQGWRMNGAIKSAERRLAEGHLVHCNQPLMAWCVGNARVEPKGNAIVITKQASGTGKIDPLIALLAAISLMAMNPEGRTNKSTYEKRGVLTF